MLYSAFPHPSRPEDLSEYLGDMFSGSGKSNSLFFILISSGKQFELNYMVLKLLKAELYYLKPIGISELF